MIRILSRSICAAAFASLLAQPSLAHAQAAINCATELYTVSQHSQLFRVNMATGAGTLMGAAPIDLTEVEYDAASGELWASDGVTGTTLHRLNPATGAEVAAVALNPAGPINGLEFIGNTLYGTRIAASAAGANPSSLVTIDRATGAVTTIGATGLSDPVSGLAYDKTNAILYGAVAGSSSISVLARIDIATGVATTIGSIGYSKVGSIEFGSDGNLYGGIAGGFVAPGGLLRINTTTGTGTLVGVAGSGLTITGLAACPPGSARTFVSATGVDTGACSATAPCRSLAYAITQTTARGEIQILDSGGYGGVNVDKWIAIAAADGVYAGISVASGAGITIDAGPSGRVVLRGLTINGLGGTRGIDLQSAAELYVDACTVSGFSEAGLNAIPAVSSSLYVHDSALRANAVGMVAGTSAAGTLHVAVERSRFESNTTGMQITQRGAVGTVRRSRFVGGTNGIVVTPASSAAAALDVHKSAFEAATVALTVGGVVGASATVDITASLMSENGTGIVTAADGTTYVSDTTIIRNDFGLQQTSNGMAISLGDNRLLGNTSNGAFSSTAGKF